MSSTQPPLEYLATASQSCLESFELARLNQISNLRKEYTQAFEQLIEAEIAARIARWILNGRPTQHFGGSVAEIAAAPRSLADFAPRRGESHQLSLPHEGPGAISGTDAQGLSVRHNSIREILQHSSESECESQVSAELESEPALRYLPVAEDPSAALLLLEQSAACSAQRIGYRGGSACRGPRRSRQRTPLLPFPEVRHPQASASAAARASPSRSLRCTRKDKPARMREKVLPLRRGQPDTMKYIAQIREGARRSAKHNLLLPRSPCDTPQPSPLSRAPRQQVFSYGNVALASS
jgi:hypothetical protein